MNVVVKFKDEEEDDVVAVAEAMTNLYPDAEYTLNQGIIEIDTNGESYEDIRNWFNDHEIDVEIS